MDRRVQIFIVGLVIVAFLVLFVIFFLWAFGTTAVEPILGGPADPEYIRLGNTTRALNNNLLTIRSTVQTALTGAKGRRIVIGNTDYGTLNNIRFHNLITGNGSVSVDAFPLYTGDVKYNYRFGSLTGLGDRLTLQDAIVELKDYPPATQTITLTFVVKLGKLTGKIDLSADGGVLITARCFDNSIEFEDVVLTLKVTCTIAGCGDNVVGAITSIAVDQLSVTWGQTNYGCAVKGAYITVYTISGDLLKAPIETAVNAFFNTTVIPLLNQALAQQLAGTTIPMLCAYLPPNVCVPFIKSLGVTKKALVLEDATFEECKSACRNQPNCGVVSFGEGGGRSSCSLRPSGSETSLVPASNYNVWIKNNDQTKAGYRVDSSRTSVPFDGVFNTPTSERCMHLAQTNDIGLDKPGPHPTQSMIYRWEDNTCIFIDNARPQTFDFSFPLQCGRSLVAPNTYVLT
ncbi:Hypothetical protein POVN_LOCUS259 [uncultured virus]|nr:Hypothetical protein POVN_LOCUS259 [uncultured virus]